MAVKQLSEVHPAVSGQAYSRIRKLVEDGRKECERAKLEFDSHLASHGC